MPVLSPQQVTEINSLIAEIEKSIGPKCEIDAHNKSALMGLLKANKETRSLKWFTCKSEYSDAIVSYFVKEKGVAKNRFHKNNQPSVFILK